MLLDSVIGLSVPLSSADEKPRDYGALTMRGQGDLDLSFDQHPTDEIDITSNGPGPNIMARI